MALIAAHLMQESFWWWQCSDRYIISLFPHLHTPLLLPVPNKPYGFCGRYAPCLLTYFTRLVTHGPVNKQGFFPVQTKGAIMSSFCWNHRFFIRLGSEKMENPGHLSCSTPNVFVYVIWCKIHKDAYAMLDQVKNLQDRWANHKSDARLERVSKCSMAPRVRAAEQASLGTFSQLQIVTIEAVSDERFLLTREDLVAI